MKNRKILWWAIGTLSIVGIILASYLLYSFYHPQPKLICDINAKVNCQAVTSGSLATFAGVPVALVGLIGFALLLFAALTERKKLAIITSSLGMLFCLRLTILEIFFIKIICPICVACQSIMFLVFLLTLYLNYKQSPK